MKRIMTLCFLIVMAVGGVRAQKGMQSIGVDFGICTDFHMESYILFGGSIKYRYHLNDNFCIEPLIQLYYGDSMYDWDNYYERYNCEAKSQKQIGLSIIYFIGRPRIWRPYLGIGYAIGNYSYFRANSSGDGIWSPSEKGPQFLIGLDKRLSYHFSLQIEAKVWNGTLMSSSLTSDTSKLDPIMASIGLTYNF